MSVPQWMLCTMLLTGNALWGTVQGQEPTQSEAVQATPFELASDFLIIVEGRVGELGGLKFIVDTGASSSVIDRKVAARLQLKRQAGRIMTFDRFLPIEWADLPELRVGSLRAEGIRVMVVDLAKYSEFAKSVDGIIGLDLLSKSKKFVIDYSKKTLYFELAGNGTHRPRPFCFIVSILVQGLAMRLEVDTGLSEILLYRDSLRKRRVKFRSEGAPKTVMMGRIEGTKVTLPGVRIGGPEEVTTVVLIDGPDERRMPGLDGYLGVASLHAKRIEFDFSKMVLLWQ
jgi:predicted aspartyl protease